MVLHVQEPPVEHPVEAGGDPLVEPPVESGRDHPVGLHKENLGYKHQARIKEIFFLVHMPIEWMHSIKKAPIQLFFLVIAKEDIRQIATDEPYAWYKKNKFEKQTYKSHQLFQGWS